MAADEAMLAEDLSQLLGSMVDPVCIDFITSPVDVLQMGKLQDVLNSMKGLTGDQFATMVGAVHSGSDLLDLSGLCVVISWIRDMLDSGGEKEMTACAGLAKGMVTKALHLLVLPQHGDMIPEVLHTINGLREMFINKCETAHDTLLLHAVSFLHTLVILCSSEEGAHDVPAEYKTVLGKHPDRFDPTLLSTIAHESCKGFEQLILNPNVELSTVLSLMNSTTGLCYYRPVLWAPLVDFLTQVLEVALSDEPEIWETLSSVWKSPDVLQRLVGTLRNMTNFPQLPASLRMQIEESLVKVKTQPEAQKRPREAEEEGEEVIRQEPKRLDDDCERNEMGEKLYDVNLPEGRKLTWKELNSWVVKSLSMIEPTSEPVPILHQQGLEKRQLDAARAEQLKEINAASGNKEILDVEAEGEVALLDLLSYTEIRDVAWSYGRDVIQGFRSNGALAQELMRLVYEDMSSACLQLDTSVPSEGHHGVAVLSRLMAQSDQAQTQDQREALLDAVIGDVRKHFNLLVQFLYSYYATSAPYSLSDDPTIHRQDWDKQITSDEVSLANPLQWLEEPKSDPGFCFAEQQDPSAQTRYTKVFEQILSTMNEILVEEYEPRVPLLSELFLNCPAIPIRIWKKLAEYFIMSDDRCKVYAGLHTLATLVKQRPASRTGALSYLLYYTTCDVPLVQAGAINILLHEVVPSDPTVLPILSEYAKGRIKKCMLIPASAPEGEVEAAIQSAGTCFFAVATKNENLLNFLFDLPVKLKSSDHSRHFKALLQHRDLHRMVKHFGATKNLLRRVHQSATGGEHLALLVLLVLLHDTRDQLASPSLSASHRAELEHDIQAIKAIGMDMYAKKQDFRFMLLLLSLCPRDSIKNDYLPEVMAKEGPEYTRIAIQETVCPYDQECGVPPVEMLVFLHKLSPGKVGNHEVTLPHIISAIDSCIRRLPHLFTEEVIAKALPQLAVLDPVPVMLFRTMLQSVIAHPKLLGFILQSIMPLLFKKHIWENKVLWRGFVKLVADHMPKSFGPLLLLPEKVLFEVLGSRRDILRPFLAFLNQNKMVHSRLITQLEELEAKGLW
eukprot:Sspe_Gene.9911::Locus_3331_Transcript_1_1_Confidence_1.000_Length_3324::g.9911::m.9911/K06100/SYMPK; symplekin